MDIEEIRIFCHGLPQVTEDLKWGNDLCFSIGGKMFCVVGLASPISMSFKMNEELFEEYCSSAHFKPAPYLARYKWVLLDDTTSINKQILKALIQNSYELIKSKLPKKMLKTLDRM